MCQGRESTDLHMEQCGASLKEDDVKNVGSTLRRDKYVMTLKALFIKELTPQLNKHQGWIKKGGNPKLSISLYVLNFIDDLGCCIY